MQGGCTPLHDTIFSSVMTSKIIKKLTYKIKSLNALPSSTVGKTMKMCTISSHHFASPNLRDLAFFKMKGFAFNSGTWLKVDVK